jgi:hypothetical protein
MPSQASEPVKWAARYRAHASAVEWSMHANTPGGAAAAPVPADVQTILATQPGPDLAVALPSNRPLTLQPFVLARRPPGPGPVVAGLLVLVLVVHRHDRHLHP